MLRGKRALVVGVANARSIAWEVADRWHREGAEVFVTYQNERFRQPVEELVRARWGSNGGNTMIMNNNNNNNGDGDGPVPAAPCDVSKGRLHHFFGNMDGAPWEDDIAALWRTLQDRGLCSLSPVNATASASTAATTTAAAAAGTDPVRGNGDGQAGRETGAGARWGAGAGVGSGDEAGAGEGVAAGEGVGPRKIDIVLHSVAHAPTEAMRQGFLKGTTQDAFVSAHVVSAYSLVSMVRHGLPFLAPGASVIALTYIGSQRAAANYNVTGPAKASLESCARALAQELGGPASANVGPGGVRVNCLSPGPVRTMAARGIAGFDEMRREAAARAPLGRDVGLGEIGGVATFLASPLASAVTGQTVYADGGFSGVV